MNRYSVLSVFATELAGCESNLHDTSYDKANNEYLCQDQRFQPVYDFDQYVQEKYKGSKTPASPDAIAIRKNDVFFVEFKNTEAKNIVKEQIQKKFISGTSILKDMLGNFRARDSQHYFCVVYKPSSRPSFFDYRHFERSVTRFDLDEMNKTQGDFYDYVITEELSFYVQHFKELCC